MKLLLSLLALVILSACGDGSLATGEPGRTAAIAILEENATWPYPLSGVLEMMEAGGYGESEYPDWAYGELIIDESGDAVPVKFGDGVARRDRIDIDSGKRVRVWLDEPVDEYGVTWYPVTRAETL